MTYFDSFEADVEFFLWDNAAQQLVPQNISSHEIVDARLNKERVDSIVPSGKISIVFDFNAGTYTQYLDWLNDCSYKSFPKLNITQKIEETFKQGGTS
jgi:hypothetical protein